jgi:hypothetical protein
MEDQKDNQMSPNYVPEELRTPYDIIELPSQGILYKNKKSSVKVEYLTAMDESILTSPNIVANNRVVEVLLERKIKDLGFDPEELLEGDRMAILVFLRVSGFGEEYKQLIYNENTNKWEEGTVNLSELKQKKLDVTPDNDGLFDYVLPNSKKKIRFRFLTNKDEKEIDELDSQQMKRTNSDISNKALLTLERQIMSLDGETDKMKISQTLKNLKIMDTRLLKKYISDIEPGLDLNIKARTQGGESVDTFLKFNRSFFWPEL